MVRNDFGEVRHTTVTELDGITIKIFMETIGFGEVLVKDLKKYFTNVCRNVVAIGGVKPCNTSFSVFFLGFLVGFAFGI